MDYHRSLKEYKHFLLFLSVFFLFELGIFFGTLLFSASNNQYETTGFFVASFILSFLLAGISMSFYLLAIKPKKKHLFYPKLKVLRGHSRHLVSSAKNDRKTQLRLIKGQKKRINLKT